MTRRRVLAVAAAVAAALVPVLAFGQNATSCPGVFTAYVPQAGFEQVTVSTTAVGLTVPDRARMAVIVTEGAAIRYRDDGTDLTAGVGVPVEAGSTLVLCDRATLAAFKAIRRDGTDAKLNVSYYGR